MPPPARPPSVHILTLTNVPSRNQAALLDTLSEQAKVLRDNEEFKRVMSTVRRRSTQAAPRGSLQEGHSTGVAPRGSLHGGHYIYIYYVEMFCSYARVLRRLQHCNTVSPHAALHTPLLTRLPPAVNAAALGCVLRFNLLLISACPRPSCCKWKID